MNEISKLQEENRKLKAEIERLKRENEIITGMHNSSSNRFDKLYNTLQEIKEIAKGVRSYLKVPEPRDVRYEMDRILDIITKAEIN